MKRKGYLIFTKIGSILLITKGGSIPLAFLRQPQVPRSLSLPKGRYPHA